MLITQIRNPIARLALIALPLIIFAIMYFTVIKPSSDTANDAIRSATHTANQQVQQIRKDAPPEARKSVDKAAQLTACLEKAGTDTGDLQQCQVKYAG